MHRLRIVHLLLHFLFILLPFVSAFDDVKVTAAEAFKDQSFTVRIQVFSYLPPDGAISVAFPPQFAFGDGAVGGFAIVTTPMKWSLPNSIVSTVPAISACKILSSNMTCYLNGLGSTLPAQTFGVFAVSSVRNGAMGLHKIAFTTWTKAGAAIEGCTTPVLVGPGLFSGVCPGSGNWGLGSQVGLALKSLDQCGQMMQFDSLAPNAVTSLSVTMAVDKWIPAGSIIEVQLPSGFQVLSSLSLISSSGSPMVGATLNTASIASNIFSVSFAKDVPRPSAWLPFGFKVLGIKNPSVTGVISSPISLRLKAGVGGGLGIVDEIMTSQLDVVPTPIAYSLSQVSSSFSALLANQDVTASISFSISTSNLTAGWYVLLQPSPSLTLLSTATATASVAAPTSGIISPVSSALVQSSTALQVNFGVAAAVPGSRIAMNVGLLHTPAAADRIALGVYVLSSDGRIQEYAIINAYVMVGNWSGQCTGRSCGLCVDATGISADLPLSLGSLTFRMWSTLTAPANAQLEIVLPQGWNISSGGANTVATTTLSGGVGNLQLCADTRTAIVGFAGPSNQPFTPAVLSSGFAVTLTSLRSPQLYIAGDLFSIRLLDAAYNPIEAGFTSIVILPGSLGVSMQQSASYLVGSVTLTFTSPQSSLPTSSQLLVGFPRTSNNVGFEVFLGTAIGQSVIIPIRSSLSVPLSMICTKTTVSGLSCLLNNTLSEVPINTALTFDIQNVRNPESGQYPVRTSTTGCAIVSASTLVTIVAGTFNTSLTPNCPLIAGATVSMVLSATQFTHFVPPLDALMVIFPASFNVTSSLVGGSSAPLGAVSVYSTSATQTAIRFPILNGLAAGGPEVAGVSITITGIQLPSANTPDSQNPFVVQLVTSSVAVSPYGSVVDAAQISGVSVAGTTVPVTIALTSATAYYQGAASFTFTPTSSLSSGSTITLNLLADSAATAGIPVIAPGTSGGITTTGTVGITCIKLTDQSVKCTVGSGTVLLTSNAITIGLPSLRNPAPSSFRSSISVSGPTGCVLFSGIGSTNIVVGSLNLTLTSSCPLVVGSIVSLNFVLSTDTYISAANTLISISLPSAMAITNASSVVATSFGTLSLSSFVVDPPSNTFSMRLGGTADIPAPQAQIAFRITSVNLVSATQQANIVTDLWNSFGVLVQTASPKSPAVVGASIPVSLTLTTNKAYTAGNFSVQFVPSQPIATGGFIAIDFPAGPDGVGFALSPTSVASVTGLAGIQCSRTLVTSILCTVASTVPAATQVVLNFFALDVLTNPQPATTYNIALSSKDPQQCVLFGGSTSVSILQTSWTTASMQPLCPLVMGGVASFVVALTSSHLIPAGDVLQVAFSSSGVVLTPGSTLAVTRSLGSLQIASQGISGSTISVTFGGATMTAQTAQSSGLAMTVQGLTLAQSATSTGTFTIRLLSGKNGVVVDSSDVAAQSITGSSVALTFTLRTYISYGIGNFSLSFTTPTNVDQNSKFSLTFPAGFVLSSASSVQLTTSASPGVVSALSCSMPSGALNLVCIFSNAMAVNTQVSIVVTDAAALTNPVIGTFLIQFSMISAAGCAVFGGSASVAINQATLNAALTWNCPTIANTLVGAVLAFTTNHMIPASDSFVLTFPSGITPTNSTVVTAKATGSLGAVTSIFVTAATRTLSFGFAAAGTAMSDSIAASTGIQVTISSIQLGDAQSTPTSIQIQEISPSGLLSSIGGIPGPTVIAASITGSISLTTTLAYAYSNLSVSLNLPFALLAGSSQIQLNMPASPNGVGLAFQSSTSTLGLATGPAGLSCSKVNGTSVLCSVGTTANIGSGVLSFGFADLMLNPEPGTYMVGVGVIYSGGGCSPTYGNIPITIVANSGVRVDFVPTCPLLAGASTDASVTVYPSHIIPPNMRFTINFPPEVRLTLSSTITSKSASTVPITATTNVASNQATIIYSGVTQLSDTVAKAGIGFLATFLSVAQTAQTSSLTFVTNLFNSSAVDQGTSTTMAITSPLTSLIMTPLTATAYADTNFTISITLGSQLDIGTHLVFDFDQPGFLLAPGVVPSGLALTGSVPTGLSCNKINDTRLDCFSTSVILQGVFTFAIGSNALRNPYPGTYTTKFTAMATTTAASSVQCSSLRGSTTTPISAGQWMVWLSSSCPLITTQVVDMDLVVNASSPLVVPSDGRIVVLLPKTYIAITGSTTIVGLNMGSLTIVSSLPDAAANTLTINLGGTTLSSQVLSTTGFSFRATQLSMGTAGQTSGLTVQLYASAGALSLQGSPASPVTILASTIAVTGQLSTTAPYADGNFSILATPQSAISKSATLIIQFPKDTSGVGFALSSTASTLSGNSAASSCAVTDAQTLTCTFAQDIAANTPITIATTSPTALRNAFPGTYQIQVSSRSSSGCALFAGGAVLTIPVGTWTVTFAEACPLVAGIVTSFTVNMKAVHTIPAGGSSVLLIFPSDGSLAITNATVVSAVSMGSLQISSYQVNVPTNSLTFVLTGTNMDATTASSTGFSVSVSAVTVSSNPTASTPNFEAQFRTAAGIVIDGTRPAGKAISAVSIPATMVLDSTVPYYTTGFTLTFTASMNITLGSVLKITFPQGFAAGSTVSQVTSTVSVSCTNAASQLVSCTFNAVHLGSTQFSLRVTAQDAIQTPAPGGYLVSIETRSGAGSCILFTGLASAATSSTTLNVTVQEDCPLVAGVTTNFAVAVSCPIRIPIGNLFRVTFPTQMTVLNTSQIVPRTMSTLTVGAVSTDTTTNSVSFVISGTSLASAPSPGISFSVAGIKMPDSAVATSPIVVTLAYPASSTSVTTVATGQSASYTVTGSVVPILASFWVSNVAYMPTNISVSLTPPRNITASSKLVISFPKTVSTFQVSSSATVQGTPAGMSCTVTDAQTITCTAGQDVIGFQPLSLVISPGTAVINAAPGSYLLQVSAVSAGGCTLFGGTTTLTVVQGTWTPTFTENCLLVSGALVNMLVAIKSPTLVASGDKVVVTFPAGIAVTNSSTVTASSAMLGSLQIANFQTNVAGGNSIVITLGGTSMDATTATNTGFSFTVSSLLVGSPTASTNAFRADSTTSAGVVVSTGSALGKGIMDVTISPSVTLDKSTAYSTGGVKVAFAPLVDLPSGSTVTVTLPTDAGSQGFIIGATSTVSLSPTAGTCTRVSNSVASCSLSAANAKSGVLTVSIAGVTNPTPGIGYVANLLAVGPTGCTLAKGQSFVQITASSINATVSTKCSAVAGTLNTLVFTLRGDMKLPPGDTLQIVLPSALTVSTNTGVAILTGSGGTSALTLFTSQVASATTVTIVLGGVALDAPTFLGTGLIVQLSGVLMPSQTVSGLTASVSLISGSAANLVVAQGTSSALSVSGNAMAVGLLMKTTGAYDAGNFSLSVRPAQDLTANSKLLLQFPPGASGGRGFTVMAGSPVSSPLVISVTAGVNIQGCAKTSDLIITCTLGDVIKSGTAVTLAFTSTTALFNPVPGVYTVTVSTTDASGCALSGGATTIGIQTSSFVTTASTCSMSSWTANTWIVNVQWTGILPAADLVRVQFPSSVSLSVSPSVTTTAATTIGSSSPIPTVAKTFVGNNTVDLQLQGQDSIPTAAAPLTSFHFDISNAFLRGQGSGIIVVSVISGPTYSLNGTAMTVVTGQLSYNLLIPGTATVSMASPFTYRYSAVLINLPTLNPASQSVAVVFPASFTVGAGSLTLTSNSSNPSAVTTSCVISDPTQLVCSVSASAPIVTAVAITSQDILNPVADSEQAKGRQWTLTCGAIETVQTVVISPGCGASLVVTGPQPRFPNSTVQFQYASRVVVPAASVLTFTLPQGFSVALSQGSSLSTVSPQGIVSSITYNPTTYVNATTKQTVEITLSQNFNGWANGAIQIVWLGVKTVPQDGSEKIPITLITPAGITLDSCYLPGLSITACLLNADLGLVSAGTGPHPLTTSFVPIRAISASAVLEVFVSNIGSWNLGETMALRWIDAQSGNLQVGPGVRSCTSLGTTGGVSTGFSCTLDGSPLTGGQPAPVGWIGILTFGSFYLPVSGWYAATVNLRQNVGAIVDQTASTAISISAGAFNDQTCSIAMGGGPDGKCVASFLPYPGGLSVRSVLPDPNLYNGSWTLTFSTSQAISSQSIISAVLPNNVTYVGSASNFGSGPSPLNSKGSCGAKISSSYVVAGDYSTRNLLTFTMGGFGPAMVSPVTPSNGQPFVYAVAPISRIAGFCPTWLTLSTPNAGGVLQSNANPWGTPPCDLGRFELCGVAKPNATSCQQCPQGTFQDSYGKSSCVACPTGQWTHMFAAWSASLCHDPCPTGQIYDVPTLNCVNCPSGTFQPIPGGGSCVSCGGGGSNPGSKSSSDCTAYSVPPNAVLVSLTINAVFADVTATPLSQATFVSNILSGIASALAISVSQLQVASMRSGSVIMDVVIQASDQATAQQLYQNLLQQLSDPNSPLRQGQYTSQISSASQISQPGGAADNGGGSNLGIIIGAVVGGVVGLAALGAIGFLVYKRANRNKSSGASNAHFSKVNPGEMEMTRSPNRAWATKDQV